MIFGNKNDKYQNLFLKYNLTKYFFLNTIIEIFVIQILRAQ